MGGKIWATSRMMKGSTFSFALPIHEPNQEDVPEIETVDLKNLRALVVQKEPMAQFATTEQLTHWGALAEAVADGGTALKALKAATQATNSFDVVLVESKLSDMSATTFLQACRALKGIDQPRVVFINELRDSVGIAFDIDATPDAELQKPILAGNLLRAVCSETQTGPLKKVSLKDSDCGKSGTKPAPDKSKKPILIVDDNRTNRKLIEVFLDRQGLPHASAENGAQAVEMANTLRPDLILMDVSMPIMNGLKAAQEIRNREHDCAGPPTRIVGLTAHSAPEDRQACLDAGMDEHMAKPIKLALLKSMVAEL